MPEDRSPIEIRLEHPSDTVRAPSNHRFRIALGSFVIASTAISCFSLLWAFRMPGTPTGAIIFAIVGGSFAYAGGLAFIVAPTYPKFFRNALLFLIVPGLHLICVVLVRNGIPFQLALRMSESELRREAIAVRKNVVAGSGLGVPYHQQNSRTCGMFPISRCSLPDSSYHVDADVVVITFDKEEFPWGHKGLYFSERPLQSAATTGWYVPHHIHGPWYWWEYTGW